MKSCSIKEMNINILYHTYLIIVLCVLSFLQKEFCLKIDIHLENNRIGQR